jgi:hypothetical protein
MSNEAAQLPKDCVQLTIGLCVFGGRGLRVQS